MEKKKSQHGHHGHHGHGTHHKEEHHHGHAHHHKLAHTHPHHKGAGMPYFESAHWQKPAEDVETANGKYSSEMGQQHEYRESVDKLAQYARKHKMQY